MERARTRGLQILMIFCMAIGLVAADDGEISDAQTQENPCLGKHGVFLPKLGKCNEYLICVEGLTTLGSCGNNHFDARRGVCDVPSRAGCISFGPEPLPVTQGICYEQKNGTKLPAEGSSSRYFVCVQGNAQLENCGQLMFDRTAQECVAVPSKPLRPLLPPCSGKQNGARVPVVYDPRKYYLCMNNRPFLKSCGDLFFSAKTASCSLQPDTEKEKNIMAPITSVVESIPIPIAVPLPSKQSLVQKVIPAIAASVESKPSRFPQANPIQKIVEKTADATIAETRSIILDRPPEETTMRKDRLALRMCQGQSFGARIPIPGTCSQYYICMGNSGILKNCGQMQFNPEIAVCDLTSNVYCRVQQGVAMYGREASEAHHHQSQGTRNLTICQGMRDASLIPAPNSCSQYYFCYKNAAIPKTCGKRHFDPIAMSCVDLELSKCIDIDSPAVQKPSGKDATVVNCLSRANGVLLKHPSDCGKFLICDNHKPVEMLCPAGLHFNVKANVCDWPEQANCSEVL